MSKKLLITLLSFIYCLNFAQAQLEKTIHQTFDVNNSNVISVEVISDSTSIITWASNTVLTETKVELYDASPSILAHYMEKELRYVINSDTTSGSYRLYNNDQERKPITTRSGRCPEIVHVRVFIPENFEKQGDTKFVRTK